MVERNRYLTGGLSARTALKEREGIVLPKHLGIVLPSHRSEPLARLFGHFDQGEGESPAHMTLIYPHVPTSGNDDTPQQLFTGQQNVVRKFLEHVVKIDSRFLHDPTQAILLEGGIEQLVLVATEEDVQRLILPELKQFQRAGITIVSIAERVRRKKIPDVGMNHIRVVSPEQVVKTVEELIGPAREA